MNGQYVCLVRWTLNGNTVVGFIIGELSFTTKRITIIMVLNSR
jgi:hypothetical protein